MSDSVRTEVGVRPVTKAELRKVVFAASLGTVFEWYDFYLYGSLAIFFSALFYPSDNPTAAFLAVLATYGAGYVVRPIGALVFGRIGDKVGRKVAFIITITVMGIATAAVGVMPTFASVGYVAPALLLSLRLLQGFALGGEYGGAAVYVAEHSAPGERGYQTSWIATTATTGLILSLFVILGCRLVLDAASFAAWGWRIPFLFSLLLLAVSVYIRLQLSESPAFKKILSEGRTSKAPISESFGEWKNLKLVLIALFGAVVGEGVVWNAGQFYVLFFITGTLKVDYQDAYLLISIALILGTPFIVLFGWLSDKVGRKWVMLSGFFLAALTLMPIYMAITEAANPKLADFLRTTHITVEAKDCNFNVFSKPSTDCDKARDLLTRAGVNYELKPSQTASVTTRIGDREILGFDEASIRSAMKANGYPEKADPALINRPAVIGLIVALMFMVGLVFGPVAAFLVELFPTRIRYTAMSLPYHVGNGVIAGFLAFFATAFSVYAGNIYAGLWYPIGFAVLSLVIGTLFLPETKDLSLDR
ncbi:MAG: MFS transporter [Bradyrhizobium sp.]|uniref:MFS transporter n=1 Tax=Bradyrhizobium sp. TaxID=376 RepID=UPI0011FF8619|nr:MFS transporter [Bradyrhizobium sp.]THD75217.1 MAG: MFS transporter [Bradyrhizobium sp.]